MSQENPQEVDLYAPVKSFLEGQGYEVKGEVGEADIVACRDDEEPIVVELKLRFSLSLFHQAVARLSMSDNVYIAVLHQPGRAFQKAVKNNLSLCRRLGIGLLTVRLKDGFVAAHLDPGPYAPRQSKVRKSRLLREFSRRIGDPNQGGSTRRGMITVYRQDALKCVKLLSDIGPTKASEVARLTGAENARRIMSDDHYGWFERVSVGFYQLSPKGVEAMSSYEEELGKLELPCMTDHDE